MQKTITLANAFKAFLEWIDQKNAVHVGTDMWKVENEHMNIERLIEKYLEDN